MKPAGNDNGKRPAHSAGPDIPRGSNLLADPTPDVGWGVQPPG